MLPFFEEIVSETHAADTLQVVARGLGMHHAATSFIASAVNDKSIILGVNISRPLATTLIWPALQSAMQQLSPMKAALLLPRFLNSDYSVRDRISVYNGSGFVVVTSAILVHDLLHDTLPVSRVNGVIVLAADQIKQRSNEHFAISLFRARNRDAFIKAFSENALVLASGFHTAEKLMRLLYVSRLVLWPRFHQSVRKSLRAHSPDLVDLAVQPSPRVVTMLTALRDTIFAVLTDLKKATRAIDFSELYLDMAKPDASVDPSVMPSRKRLVYNFDDVVRRQVEEADSFVPPRVRSLVADLATLRVLLRDAFDLDAVQFYQRVVTVRHAIQRGHSWLVRKEAQTAILMARSRVWVVRKRNRSKPNDETSDTDKAPSPSVTTDPGTGINFGAGEVEQNAADIVRGPGVDTLTIPTLEPCPKWKALRDVLREIRADVCTAGATADVARVLVIVREQRLVDELRAVLTHTHGESHYLHRQFCNIFPSVAQRAERAEEAIGLQQVTMTQLAVPGEGHRRRSTAHSRNRNFPTSNQPKHGKGQAGRVGIKRSRSTRSISDDPEDRARSTLDDVFREINSDISTDVEVLVWCMEWVDLQGRGHRVLDEYRPAFVVLYNADLAFVRQVEVYKASHPGRPVRMYILSYDDSAEEERFRNASGREKAAFKTLIRERATMTVQFDQEGRLPEIDFTQQMLAESGDQSPRRKGLGNDRDSRLSADGTKPKHGGSVIVDTRELRSSLPMLLHQSNLTIVPITLEVADFVLSNDIGIERKSVPDLHGSFGSGRLFNQAEALCRHYKSPCLLIELDANRPLSLTAVSGGVPTELLATSIVSKMVLLVQQFPTLRLLWAKGPHDAAELFAKLKEHEKEPDVKVAIALGVDTKESEEETFNAGPKALLRSLPGIDSNNIQRVMRRVRNVAILVTMTQDEMTDALGSASKAAKLFKFVHEQPSEALAAL